LPTLWFCVSFQSVLFLPEAIVQPNVQLLRYLLREGDSQLRALAIKVQLHLDATIA